MGEFRGHSSGSLRSARDLLSNTIQHLRSAGDRMTGEDWLDVQVLIVQLMEDVGPRLSKICEAADERLSAMRGHEDFAHMQRGDMPYIDERPLEPETSVLASSSPSLVDIPVLKAPNAKEGAKLVVKHGSVEQALMAYQPDSIEADHIKAWLYVTTGIRPMNWIPTIVRFRDGMLDSDPEDLVDPD